MTYDPEKDGVWVPLYIIEMTSSINAAILLAQLSWMLQEDRSKMRRGPVVQLDGGEWVARTDSDWSDIRLDRSAAHRARQGLERDGLIEVRASKANGRKVTLLRPCYEPLQKARIRAIEKRESAQIKARIRAIARGPLLY